MFSTDTEEQARTLLVITCPRNLNGDHVARELVDEQSLENLQAFSDKLAAAWERLQPKEQKMTDDREAIQKTAPDPGSRWLHRRDKREVVFDRVVFDHRPSVDGIRKVAFAEYHYVQTSGRDAPGNIRRGSGKRGGSSTPTQRMPLAEWLALFSLPVRRDAARALGRKGGR